MSGRSIPSERGVRVCPGTGKAHKDAEKLVLHLISAGGTEQATNEEICRSLNFMRRLGGGVSVIDTGRFHRARQHIMDGLTAEAKPCCGYNVHYRRAGGTSILALIDPSGGISDHVRAAAGAVFGSISRLNQQHTEIRRMTQYFEHLADFALAREDKAGYRVLMRAQLELEKDGTIHSATIGEMLTWLADLAGTS